MKKRALSAAAAVALQTAVIDRSGVKVPSVADKVYREINNVFAELGGAWNRKTQRHTFPTYFDWQTPLAEIVATGEAAFARDSGYYPTPEHIAEMMIRAAEFEPGDVFFEPNAGRGHILKLVRNYSIERNLDLQLFGCELNPLFVSELRADNFKIAAGDFLSFDPVERADRILMNPPFDANGGSIQHALHAFKHLKTGGKLIIVTRADIERGRTRRRDDWRQLCDNCLTFSHDLPSDTFKEAGARVETKINVFLKKDAVPNFG